MKSLYTAATGMSAQQMRIENISNNLANVSTIGFKKSREKKRLYLCIGCVQSNNLFNK